MINLAEIKTTKRSYRDIESNLLVVGLFQDKQLNPQLKSLDVQIENKLSHAMDLEKFIGKKATSLSLYGSGPIKRIILIGLGKQKNYTTDTARSIASNIICYADELKIESFTVDGDSLGLKKNLMTQAFAEGLILGSYRFDDYKTKKDEDTRSGLALVSGNVDKKSLEQGRILGASVCFARDLGNHPARLQPSGLAATRQGHLHARSAASAWHRGEPFPRRSQRLCNDRGWHHPSSSYPPRRRTRSGR